MIIVELESTESALLSGKKSIAFSQNSKGSDDYDGPSVPSYRNTMPISALTGEPYSDSFEWLLIIILFPNEIQMCFQSIIRWQMTIQLVAMITQLLAVFGSSVQMILLYYFSNLSARLNV